LHNPLARELPYQGSPEHKFPRKIKAKRLVDVQTEAEQDCNEALFAVDVLLTGSAAVEVDFYVNFPGGVVDPRVFGFRHLGLVAMYHPRRLLLPIAFKSVRVGSDLRRRVMKRRLRNPRR
jgi:hypothetical protein